jgi:hypothetical protein
MTSYGPVPIDIINPSRAKTSRRRPAAPASRPNPGLAVQPQHPLERFKARLLKLWTVLVTNKSAWS